MSAQRALPRALAYVALPMPSLSFRLCVCLDWKFPFFLFCLEPDSDPSYQKPKSPRKLVSYNKARLWSGVVVTQWCRSSHSLPGFWPLVLFGLGPWTLDLGPLVLGMEAQSRAQKHPLPAPHRPVPANHPSSRGSASVNSREKVRMITELIIIL